MKDNNTCDKCGAIERSTELNWITSEDFEYKEGEMLSDEALKKYDALCEPCYRSELIEKEITKKQNELEELYAEIERKVDPDTMSMFNEMIDLELELEKECNQ